MQISKGEGRSNSDDSFYRYLFLKQQPPCFVASGINKPTLTSGKPSGGAWYHPFERALPEKEWYNQKKRDYLKLSGKVCSTEEFSAFLIYPGQNLGWVDGVDCRNSEKSQCVGIGFSGFDSEKLKPYKSFFIPNTPKLLYQNAYKSCGDTYSCYAFYVGAFRESMNFYHMPVVKVSGDSGRSCRPSRIGQIEVASGNYVHNMRLGYRSVGDLAVEIPSICGEDLDKLIDRLVPRPAYLSIPEIDN